MEGRKSEDGKAIEGGMSTIKGRLRPHLDDSALAFRLEKWFQIHAGGRPSVYFSLYRLLRQDLSRIVTQDTQLVIEGFPRSGNSSARRAFVMPQNESSDTTRTVTD